jgi:hypothetical protein
MYQIVDTIDAVSPFELTVVASLLVAAALGRAYGPISEEDVERWERAHGVEVDDEIRPVVERYLRRSRVCRAWGAIAGLLAPTVIRPLLGEPVHVAGIGPEGAAPGELGLVFVGYVAGALWAELSAARPSAPARRAALLPRDLADYLPRRLVWLQRILAAGCALSLMALPLVDPGPNVEMPTWAAVTTMSAVIVLFAAGVERLELWIVRRAQPFVSEPLLAADDAIRAQSIHAVAGGGVAFLFFAFGLAVYSLLATSSPDLTRNTLLVPGAVALVAYAACRHYGDRAWRVRRQRRGAASA